LICETVESEMRRLPAINKSSADVLKFSFLWNINKANKVIKKYPPIIDLLNVANVIIKKSKEQ
jgi:hypothetical protein